MNASRRLWINLSIAPDIWGEHDVVTSSLLPPVQEEAAKTKKAPETKGLRDFAVGLTGFEPATP